MRAPLQGQGGGQANFGPQLPTYVPGAKPNVYTNGMAQRIFAGSDLVMQVHYAPTSVDEPDSSTVNLFFDYTNYDYADFRDVLKGGAPGTEPLYQFDATIYRLFFSAWF